ncbi:AUGMIN subunit 6 [Brachypodium distachyon]|uniref:Uncharacterized protein n=1 Tax=Brachypodium distachyon TaxID=15368 RepID=A0A0Q3FX27_BRADI|nr:AUGMIN subunit 6 [Brachypodium distachyon]XP_024313960.1 AUGMIN subunit 6 [Brachypodium distachyon]KQK02765.1 hypothetical protein BRADI_2g03550v3 [Brachypodium distachyon]KQK02766.1 hypothetical protein BRADI_2g03550v3 [Brachypodium distachyon]KQK02767.1 hypothetical protein BRADI_2g03550v3 [Brachypodium distachyon]PNT69953.1 hypothetical protein BRADI_2g03550v3 [Brachypodium distachyon]PNT69954.1 hypothetical protein BRADI_2g03550v3 [Brachypodium distachyon]|eukprot:XP_024313959.1 AUGMIN subunit 6 [Brachypodium distachyon]
MSTDREKERESELEGAMYTSCLLLSLDPAVLSSPAGATFPASATPTPASDFDKVWPIFDSAQSREFGKSLAMQEQELM